MNLYSMYKSGEKLLKSAENESFKSELIIILKYLFNIDRGYIVAHNDREMTPEEENLFFDVIAKRREGVPLQYILGVWEFMGLEFCVGEGVLIPREDTSVLVNKCTEVLLNKHNGIVADLCSGTGCVAVSLERTAKNISKIYAIELSKKAYSYLEKNIKKLGSSVIPINDDVFKAYNLFQDNFFDAVVSNPPYIRSGDIKKIQKEVGYEPFIALNGGKDGLYFYKKICSFWHKKIKSGGSIVFEIGYDQYEDVKSIMLENGFEDITCSYDINNIKRVIAGIKL